jgi:hypothetical protein
MSSEELHFPPEGPCTKRWPSPITVHDLIREIDRARAKFPGNRFLLAALMEELGELAEAMVDGTREEAYKEAIQVACVALRIAEEEDSATYTPGLFIALVKATGRVARGLLQRQAVTLYLAAASSALQRMLENGLKKTPVDPSFEDITDEEAKS